MFDFGNANSSQIEAITTCDGPVLIIAGPGTGKTYTLVQRTVYLIQKCGVLPEQIFIATFTEKAAKEIITRITNELITKNIFVNVNEMYVGTFHSLCLRIIKENIEFTRLKRNYRLLDAFDQKYLVFQNIYKFKNIKNYENIFSQNSSWKLAEEICSYVNNLSEELVNIADLYSDSSSEIIALADVMSTYQQLIQQENLIDFATIQTECFRLISEFPDVLKTLQDKFRYLMIDEYQDTNYIQEQIVLLLAGKQKNICVVGDDDQGLYRFRGATIRNILEFPSKFLDGECKIISLAINYRSNKDIVDFYNKWMLSTDGSKFKFSWDKFRYTKKIEAHSQVILNSPAVVKLSSKNDTDEWHERIFNFISNLKRTGRIENYNQIAFLFNSVKHQRVTKLADYLENRGINVYSPRSDMFFSRNEIKLTLGFLMLMFPKYVRDLEKGEYEFLREEHCSYFRDCIISANEFVSKEENKDLKRFIRAKGKLHYSLIGTTDYAYCGLMYQLFQYEPFVSILNTEMNLGVMDIRPVRNLSLLTQIINKYEYLHRINVLSSKSINQNTERLFNLYLRLLIDGGISEYEDDSEYAPSGCVSFMTIHQSKGMEFPIVFVDSLSNVPRKSYKEFMSNIEQKYFHRSAFEPYEQMKYFDFWRLYYTAFSRAQDLLILTCDENSKTPSKYIAETYKEIQSVDNQCFDINEFEFHNVKATNLKDTFSFTSHITVFETCSLQYKFYKELEFSPVRQSAMIFGTLVHETIEDIHRCAIRGEESQITQENILNWFESNYASLVKSEHTFLDKPQKDSALKQVLRYADRQNGNWDNIKEAEVDVSLVKPDYIIEGKIDLIKGHDGTVEIVDFKSEKKPDMELMRSRIEHYRRQLHIYAYLVEQRTGLKVSKMHLYYTGEEDGNPLISFPYTKSAIEGTVSAFDNTVHKILNKEFNHCAESIKTCKNCDFRFYCQNY